MNIYELAKICGCSIATISKALNNRKDVKESTRRLVLAKAQEHGYVANPNARALALKGK